MLENAELQQLKGSNKKSQNTLEHQKSIISKLASCPGLGLILTIFSSVCFSIATSLVKVLAEIDPFELAAFRFVGIFSLAIIILIYKGEHPFPKGRRVILLLRSFIGASALMLIFYACRQLPLADVHVIVFSAPVFVGIFARIFLKEPCNIFNVCTVSLTLMGVVLIARPQVIFKPDDISVIDNYKKSEQSSVWGLAAAFSSTLLTALCFITLRALKDVHFSVTMTVYGFVSLVQSVIVTWVNGAFSLPQTDFERFLVVLLALFSFAGQILLTVATQIEDAGPVSIARSIDIVFAFIWQVVLFKEIPTKYSIGGAILVMSSVILTGLRKWVITLPKSLSVRKS